MIAEVIEDGNANSHQQALNLIKRDPSIIQKLPGPLKYMMQFCPVK